MGAFRRGLSLSIRSVGNRASSGSLARRLAFCSAAAERPPDPQGT